MVGSRRESGSRRREIAGGDDSEIAEGAGAGGGIAGREARMGKAEETPRVVEFCIDFLMCATTVTLSGHSGAYNLATAAEPWFGGRGR